MVGRRMGEVIFMELMYGAPCADRRRKTARARDQLEQTKVREGHREELSLSLLCSSRVRRNNSTCPKMFGWRNVSASDQ